VGGIVVAFKAVLWSPVGAPAGVPGPRRNADDCDAGWFAPVATRRRPNARPLRGLASGSRCLPGGTTPRNPPMGRHLRNASSCGPGGGRVPSRPGGPLEGPGTCRHTGPAPPPHRPGTCGPHFGRRWLTTPARNLRAGAGPASAGRHCPRGRWRPGSPEPVSRAAHTRPEPLSLSLSLRQEEDPGRRQCPDSPVTGHAAQPGPASSAQAPGTGQPSASPRRIRRPATAGVRANRRAAPPPAPRIHQPARIQPPRRRSSAPIRPLPPTLFQAGCNTPLMGSLPYL
jgi:hypothetical protein